MILVATSGCGGVLESEQHSWLSWNCSRRIEHKLLIMQKQTSGRCELKKRRHNSLTEGQQQPTNYTL